MTSHVPAQVIFDKVAAKELVLTASALRAASRAPGISPSEAKFLIARGEELCAKLFDQVDALKMMLAIEMIGKYILAGSEGAEFLFAFREGFRGHENAKEQLNNVNDS